MFSFTATSAQSIALTYSHRINKATSALLTAPIKGYKGACPFLRSLGTISNLTTNRQLSSSASSSSSSSLETENNSSLNCRENYAERYHNNEQQQQQQHRSSSSSCTNHQYQHNKQDKFDRYEEQQQQQQHQHQHQHQGASIETGLRESPEAANIFRTVVQPEPFIVNDSKEKQQPPEQQIYNYDLKLHELIKKKKEDGSYRVFRKVRRFSSNFPHGLEQGRPVTIWCSNDYFGMSSHPKVRQAIIKALNEYGAGSGGTRNIAGNSPVHEKLEWELADLHNKEAALLFSSCFVANDSTLFTLLKLIPNCEIFSDAGNHASMIQGIRNSGAKKHIFRAFDCEDLERKLKQVPLSTPKIVAFETVHSMTGDISDVERMCDIAHSYGALTFVDEVHAVGLYGERGAGIAQRDGCMDKIDIVSGTLGKAYGNCGGYVASSADLIDVVRSYAAGFIFTTSLPPTIACGARESVRILKSDEGRYLRQMQQNNVFHMKRALTAAGLPHYHSQSHIVPIPVGDPARCTKVSADLLESGHYIQSINYPTVPKGTERLRVSVTPFHNEQMIDSLIERLVSVWQSNGLDFLPPVEVPNQCRRHQMKQQSDTQVGQSLWCYLCHKEIDLCTRQPDSSMLNDRL